MKNLNLPRSIKASYLSILLTGVFLSACNKSSLYQNQLSPSTNTIALSEDSIFKSLVFDLRDYNEVVANTKADTIMNQQDFEINFNNAVKNNDAGSRKIIANTMGFSNDIEFWETRNKMINKIYLLSKKYDFRNISLNNLEKLASNQISNSKIINLSNKKYVSLDYDYSSCIDNYRNCIDQATANFAVEQVGCVGMGVFSWTIIGGAFFIACEAASNYHLYVNDRTCGTNFTYCK